MVMHLEEKLMNILLMLISNQEFKRVRLLDLWVEKLELQVSLPETQLHHQPVSQ